MTHRCDELIFTSYKSRTKISNQVTEISKQASNANLPNKMTSCVLIFQPILFGAVN